MATVGHIFAIVVMALILAFSLIHLGVSVGIIVPCRKYGDIFRPQLGLSAFNLVICIFGFVTGALGLAALLMKLGGKARMICVVLSSILGVFAIASLITALVINAKSVNYVTSHFLNNLVNYNIDRDARSRIDRLQDKYQCCGADTWLDWTRANLDGTATTTTESSTGSPTTLTGSVNSPTVTDAATTSVSVITSVSTATITTTSTVGTTTTASTIRVTSTTATNVVISPNGTDNTSSKHDLRNVKRDIVHISNNLHPQQSLMLDGSSRQKRQDAGSYPDVPGLPVSFRVVLPRSCCTNAAIFTGNTSDSFCISNANGTANNYYKIGCAKPMDTDAGNQAMGFGIINSCMFILALVAIPLMLVESPTSD